MWNVSPMSSSLFAKAPSSAYLWTATLIFAASNAVTRKITEIGAQHLIDGRNPISLCNVLFVGNLCALVVMVFIFTKDWNQRLLGQLNRKDWLGLGAIAILSGALGPGFIFAALDNTSVTNVVLISRLEPPLILALSILFLKARVNSWTIAGSVLTFTGVAITTLMASSGQRMIMMGGLIQIGKGELFAVVGAFVLAIAAIISKMRLQSVPLGIFMVFRTALGTLIFFILAVWLYGIQHFADVASPLLWQWMLLYGAIIVVAGQLCWFTGLKGATSAEVTLANSFNPLAAIAIAYLILGEVPTATQYLGGSIVLVGVVLSAIGNLREFKSQKVPTRISLAKHLAMAIGFRGI
jgi:drug/metabolite transporter (DMT)-like permease